MVVYGLQNGPRVVIQHSIQNIQISTTCSYFKPLCKYQVLNKEGGEGGGITFQLW